MSLPNIPDINPNITLTLDEVLNLILASIALEEIGLAHILNAEGEKIQTLAGLIETGQVTMDQIEQVQNSVSKVLKKVIDKEMLLEFKLEDIIEIINRTKFIHENIATVIAIYNDIQYMDTDRAYYHTDEAQGTSTPMANNPVAQDISVQSIIGGVDLGNLTNYLFFFADGSIDANWQGATKGFIGDVAVDGIQASERTSGDVPYAGTIYTNDTTLGAWQAIIDQNPTQASGVTGQTALISSLETDLVNAFNQINALPATPGFESVSSTSLDGLNTQNGINETFVINITSGLNFSQQINITGDAGDVFILRWDEDPLTPGYQGQVKPQSGGAIVPHGGLLPSNFINVAGNINASGGGTTPPPPYPQGPRYNDGQGALIIGGSDFSGGGFFTGYWLTTGTPTEPYMGLLIGETDPLSNGIFVGGWYTLTTKFSMTSGTSGVYVAPNPATEENPAIQIIKEVSPDNGVTWYDADTPTGPYVIQGTNPQFRYTVTNTGNVTLTNINVTDNIYGFIGSLPSLAPGQSFTWTTIQPWQSGQHTNIATVTADYNGLILTDSNPANYFGAIASIQIIKQVSPDNGLTWYDADTPTGPYVPQGINPQFRYIVTNTGNVTLTDVNVTDNIYGPIYFTPTLAPGETFVITVTEPWNPGQHTNIATVTGNFEGVTYTDSNPANYFGLTAVINIIKQVSPDNGVTWYDADTPTGPTVPQGTNPQFRYIVTNNSNVILTNIQVTDNVYGLVGTLPSLAPGASFEWITVQPWMPGQQTNIATVTGDFEGITYTDSNPANYFGAIASIQIIKQVSPDNGITWFDADTPPGPTIPQGTNPQFRYIVTNPSNVTLTNVTVTDDVYGLIGTLPSLAPGASFEWITVQPWMLGQQTNIATATGDYDGVTYTDTNPANYIGEEATINVTKYVSPDNGVTWFDANTPPGPEILQGTNPQFRYVVFNPSNVTLTNVVLTDNVYGLVGTLPSLAPGASFEWITVQPWMPGQQTNIVTATGDYNGVTYVATDPANYFGAIAAIRIIKYVSPDNGVTWFDADSAPGPTIIQGTNPKFRYSVTNTGNVTMNNILVTDNVYGFIGSLPQLLPGESFEWIITQPWTQGDHENIATVTGVYDDQVYTDTNPAHYFGALPSAIQIVKYVSVDNGLTWEDANTPPGPYLGPGIIPQFKYVVTNTGGTTLTDITVTDNVYGFIGTLPSLAPGASYEWIIIG